MATKNLGQVAGVFIGNVAPSNNSLIWYDNTPGVQVHKVYDIRLSKWVVLEQSAVSALAYSELVNIAKKTGLSIGQYFCITDRGNILALAITSTKVQYSDSVGNILIDDLGTSVQYHVTSSNLQIDDVVGVFDTVAKTLSFNFTAATPDFTNDNEYVLGKSKKNNVWSLVKYKISSFLSTSVGNSITWKNGFFFNFSNAIKDVINKTGGVVGKDQYDKDKDQLTAAINNVGKENQTIIQNAHKELVNATSATVIYNLPLPSISTTGEPIDIAKNNTLLNIISKIQRYINKFKFATGIRISKDFADAVEAQYVNNNDTVDSAIRKIQYWLKNIGSIGALSSTWEPKDYTTGINDVAAKDTVDEAFAKVVGKINQIGDISNGIIQSKATSNLPPSYSPASITNINLTDGVIKLRKGNNAICLDSSSGISYSKYKSQYGATYSQVCDLNEDGVTFSNIPTKQSFDIPEYESSNTVNYSGLAAIYMTSEAMVNDDTKKYKYIAGLMSKCFFRTGDIGNSEIVDAYFAKLKAGGLYLGVYYTGSNSSSTIYLPNDCSIVRCANSDSDIFLPTDVRDGHVIMFCRSSTSTITIYGNDVLIADTSDNSFALNKSAIVVFSRTLANKVSASWYIVYKD